MPIINAEARAAGALILSKMRMFNEAVVFMEQTLGPALSKGFDICIGKFIKENQWIGKVAMENDTCWIAPNRWKNDDGGSRAWFEIHWHESGEKDYWLATLTGNGTESGEFGFLFDLDRNSFGGKSFNQYAKSIKSADVERLEKLGFNSLGKGKFFLPLHLDGELLAQCWQEYGEFPHDDDVFGPLRYALNVLAESVPIFDQILQDAP
ncbi:hypothetical protein [Enterobacillus tribolii]|uniref:DUF3137 domain-containing protein n=1 Tax=Enterobacillus tribolii TaxID=1487935 RepID=A0A370R351_9GAMM|nr:hypothetical protein [Enterobacillus tribolii]MBW7983914.1 hypothetical protein [Enterobacillus tribolii]RDK96851.1 hypothetical protein C8D90_101287 [Enterobacillus tribolii]